ncbi:MAG: hypothetical protein GEU81_14310 [Nitriliruptorales bacterium]|nr:hypothetical protein [Nitriliruptorales bacterium]
MSVADDRTAPPAEPAGTARGAGWRRRIGPLGTAARVVVGLALLGDVMLGHWTGEFGPASWVLGLVGFPTVLLAWQWARARRGAPPLRATGLVGHTLNVLVFLALYLTFWYAPVLSITSDAALIFYGASMLLAAGRGYAGCEVLAASNWLLRRDDQVGCILFAPVDHLERRERG